MELDILRVAHLARLELSEAEAAEYGSQLGQILDYIEQIKGLDVSGIEPTAHATAVFDIYREDQVSPERVLTQNEALQNAPAVAHNQVKMPKVIE